MTPLVTWGQIYWGISVFQMQKKDLLSFTSNIGKISSKLHVASINKSVFKTDLLFACSHLLHSVLLLCYLSTFLKNTKPSLCWYNLV